MKWQSSFKVFIKLMYNHCFKSQRGGAERRGPKAPKVASILGGSSRSWAGGAEGTRGQGGRNGGLGPELNPSHPCQIVL